MVVTVSDRFPAVNWVLTHAAPGDTVVRAL